MVLSLSRIIAPGYGDLPLGGAELEEIRSLHILGVTLDLKLTLLNTPDGSKFHRRTAVGRNKRLN